VRSILADTGPLVALFKRDDRHHKATVRWANANRVRLATTWPVVTAACHFLALPGRIALFQFVERGGLSIADIVIPDLREFAAVMTRYADRAVDLADASLVLLAERTGSDEIITIDRTDFSVYRIGRNRQFKILFP